MAWADDGEGVGYELDDWEPEQRHELSAALEAEGVPHHWEGAELVVAVGDADVAGHLIDGIDHPDALPAEEDDDDVAADVLLAAPNHPAAGADLAATATRASSLPTPYGLDDAVWAEVRRRAEALAALMSEDSDDGDITAAARSLRQVVWPLV